MKNLRVQWRAWWRRHELTEALAGGANPYENAELALVATRLIRFGSRRGLAAGLERVLRVSAGPLRPWNATIPLNRAAIAEMREELTFLAERLRDPAPMPVQTVARVAALLQDGSGPLYGSPAMRLAASGRFQR